MSPTTRAIRDFLGIVLGLLSLLALYSVAAIVMDDPKHQTAPAQIEDDRRDQ